MGTEGYCHDMRRKGCCYIMGFGMMLCHEKERMLLLMRAGRKAHEEIAHLAGLRCITSVPSFNCRTSIKPQPNKNMAPRSSEFRDESLGSFTVQKLVQYQKRESQEDSRHER